MKSPPAFAPDLAFEIVYSRLGGRWIFDDAGPVFQSNLIRYIDSIPGVLASLADQRLREAADDRVGVLPEMHFGMINGQALNCYATRFNGRYFVGIGAMVPSALLEVAAFFFAQPGFYFEIGDPQEGPLVALDGVEALPFFQIAENRFTPRIKKGLSDRESDALARSFATVRSYARHSDQESGKRLTATEYLLPFDTLIDVLLPTCVVRREHVKYVASILAHFFWYHEMAHVTQGHLRSLQGESEGLTLCEFPSGESEMPRAPGDGASIMRLDQPTTLAMEFDADVEAILLSLGTIMLDADIESDEFPYVDKFDRVELFVLFLVIVFQILSRRERDKFSRQPPSHPPADLRLFHMLTHLTHMASEDNELTSAIGRGLSSARQLSKSPLYPFLSGVLDGTTSYPEEALAIERHRAELVSGFDSYRYGNLRVLVGGVIEELGILKKMTLGPEPEWWHEKN